MGPEIIGKLAPQRMALYDVRPAMKILKPSHLQALGTFGHLQNSSVHIAEHVRNLLSILLSGGNEMHQSCDLAITKV